mgnify:FL=1
MVPAFLDINSPISKQQAIGDNLPKEWKQLSHPSKTAIITQIYIARLDLFFADLDLFNAWFESSVSKLANNYNLPIRKIIDKRSYAR